MTTVGYPDFLPSVYVADQPVKLLDVADTANSTDHDVGDVRRFASYTIQASYLSTPGPSATNYATLIVRFFADATLTPFMSEDLIEIAEGGAQTLIRDAMGGGEMVVTTQMPGVAGQTLNLAVIGSNRPIDRLRVLNRNADDRIPVANTITALAAGATTTTFVPLLYGPGFIRFETVGQPGQITIFAGTLTQYLDQFALAAAAQLTREFLLPLRALRIDVKNTGAAAGDYKLTVWARDN